MVNKVEGKFLKLFIRLYKFKLFILLTIVHFGFSQVYSRENINKSDSNLNISYQELPEGKSLRANNQVGKLDPFSSVIGGDSNELNYIKLLGVYKTNFNKAALLKYNEQIGEITVGSVGGKDTLLIPNKALVKDISVINSSIIIQINSREYEIKL